MFARQPDARLYLQTVVPTGEEAENVACQQQNWHSLAAWPVHARDFLFKMESLFLKNELMMSSLCEFYSWKKNRKINNKSLFACGCGRLILKLLVSP